MQVDTPPTVANVKNREGLGPVAQTEAQSLTDVVSPKVIGGVVSPFVPPDVKQPR